MRASLGRQILVTGGDLDEKGVSIEKWGASLIRTILYRSKCSRLISSTFTDLSAATGGWAPLYKLSVCCPGLFYNGDLLENSKFGLEHEISLDNSYRLISTPDAAAAGVFTMEASCSSAPSPVEANAVAADCWSLFNILYFDNEYDAPESPLNVICQAWLQHASGLSSTRNTGALSDSYEYAYNYWKTQQTLFGRISWIKALKAHSRLPKGRKMSFLHDLCPHPLLPSPSSSLALNQ